MASNPNDPISQNIAGVNNLVSSRINKLSEGGTTQQEGPTGEFEPTLSLDLEDDTLLRLARSWEQKYAPYEKDIKSRQEKNLKYYLGKQREGGYEATDNEPIGANLIFEAEETFLPAALSRNPEPVVWSASQEAPDDKLARSVKSMLQYHGDTLCLRQKLSRGVRMWSLFFLGVWKHGWDAGTDDITLETRDPREFIFDPDGFVDPKGRFVGYLGERIKTSAETLSSLYPEHAEYIEATVEGKLGTEVTYTQWWDDTYTFSTYRNRVLEKSKNPHFNYSGESDIDGVPQAAYNHFPIPLKPYTFLSVFTIGTQPHDLTGLIEQNIPNQRRISRRTIQIDYNLSRQNNSTIFSSDNWDQQTAKQAAMAMLKGHPVLVPKGRPINESIETLPAQGLPSDFFVALENDKNDLRQIFGTQGITAQQPDEDQTARGMILNQQYDNSRIGGGIGDALEQVADGIFNWWVQLYAVYYDQPRTGAVIGQLRATERATIQASSFTTKLVVSVAPNSMSPKDEVNERNQALALWDRGALDPKTLFTILGYADPDRTAAMVTLWKIDPVAYMRLNFPDISSMAFPPVSPTNMTDIPPPEMATEPTEGLSVPPASSDLSNVDLPPIPA